MHDQSGQSVVNFGRNVEFTPESSFSPSSEDEILEILAANRGKRIRVTGRKHSWSDAIVATEIHLDLRQMRAVEIEERSEGTFVKAGAGCQIKELLTELKPSGLTLPSLGLIDEQTVAGATATGTHGSGKNSLSHYIESIRIAHYDSQSGEPVISEISSGAERLAARCSLGLLGVIVSVTFQCRESYNIEEFSEKYETLDDVLAMQTEYPLQQFFLMPWSWKFYGQHRVETGKSRSRSAFWYRVYWSLFIDIGLHVVIFTLARVIRFRFLIRFFFRWILPATIARNWKVVDDSHKMLVMEHELFRHIEIEMFVTRSNLPSAIEFVCDAIAVFGGDAPVSGSIESRDTLAQFKGAYFHHYPVCVRRILPDETLISMASPNDREPEDDWYAISLISYHWPTQREGFFRFARFIATAMADQFSARAHWGKYNPLTPAENEKLYPGLSEFRKIRKEFDSNDAFLNDWLADNVYSS